MKTNLEIVREFVTSWARLDAAELSAYFTEDGTYYNMPAEPVSGRENIEKFINGFIAPWTSTDWEILSMAADGDVVFCERLDRTKSKNGDVDLPCLGVFEMRDGKIYMWRDYFDMNTYIKAMS